MLKRQNIKSKVASGGSCLLLLLLAFAFLNPIATSVYADEVDEEYGGNAAYFNEAVVEGEIETYAASTVGISFSPTSGSASLSPTTSAGQTAQIKVLATINVQKSGGYSVYLKSNSQNLVGAKDSENVIPGMQGSSTYANMPVNTWGYYAAEGNTVPDSASYKAVSTTGNGDKITENTSNKIASDTKTIALSFAAKVNDEKPADTYQNTVTMSVVSSPWAIAEDFGIGDMQEMTSTVCENAKDNDGDGVISGQLKDTRDGKYYWISKLADGHCWMTQNLDLDLSTKVALTPGDSDVKTNWTPEFDTATVADGDTILESSTGTRSWSLGDVRITKPTESNDCGYPKNSVADCPAQFTTYATPTSANNDELAHYILGNHYQWNTATAGTGGSITSGQANSSICPKGWKLPESNAATTGTFAGLVNAYSIGSDVVKLTSSPLYFARGGYVNQNTNTLFENAGNGGIYWSSTPNSSGLRAYVLGFWGAGSILPSYHYDRVYGFSVRCIAE